jgi:hypothetical protein
MLFHFPGQHFGRVTTNSQQLFLVFHNPNCIYNNLRWAFLVVAEFSHLLNYSSSSWELSTANSLLSCT